MSLRLYTVYTYNNRNAWVIGIEGYTFELATCLASRALEFVTSMVELVPSMFELADASYELCFAAPASSLPSLVALRVCSAHVMYISRSGALERHRRMRHLDMGRRRRMCDLLQIC
jgi:hypothetical protein